MGATSRIEKEPGGTRVLCGIDITGMDMKKQRKPGECMEVEITGEDMSIYVFPNGRTKELKGMVSVALKNTGRGDVKVNSVKITLVGKTTSSKDWNIPAGLCVSCDGLCRFDECRAAFKSGLIRPEVELDGVIRKQESKENTPSTKTSGMSGGSVSQGHESCLKNKKTSRRKNIQETGKDS